MLSDAFKARPPYRACFSSVYITMSARTIHRNSGSRSFCNSKGKRRSFLSACSDVEVPIMVLQRCTLGDSYAW